MAADFTVKAHDVQPSIQAALTSGSSPVDLTGATVKFIMALKTGGTPVVNATATIVAPATGGVVRYDWVTADTSTPGSFNAEWQVTFPSGKKQTFPTLTYHDITVVADLDNA